MLILAEGLPLGWSIAIAILFTALFGGYILWASCRRGDRPSDRTGEYDA